MGETARFERIPWKGMSSPDPVPPVRSPRQAPRIRGGMLAVLLLLVGAGVLYHNTGGQRIVGELESVLGVTPATTSVAPAAGTQGLYGMLTEAKALPGMIQAGDWTGANRELQTIQIQWDAMAGQLAKAGVQTVDINGFTSDLANLTTVMANRDSAASLVAAANVQKSLAWLATSYVAAQSPTLTELSQLVSDLNQAAGAGDLARVRADAQALDTLVQGIQKGF